MTFRSSLALLLLSASLHFAAAESETTTKPKPIRIALYHGPETGGSGPPKLLKRLDSPPQFTITNVSPEQIRGGALTNFDIVIFAGGSASKQAGAISAKGIEAVRGFVEKGGGYVGICAGAYLATCGSENTRLNLVNATTISPKWKRGSGFVEMELTAAGTKILTPPARSSVRYVNGPIVKPAGKMNLPQYEALALFRTELAENNTPPGIMVNSPAIFAAKFGQGRVVCISPHPEQTEGSEHFVPQLISWAAETKTSNAIHSESK